MGHSLVSSSSLVLVPMVLLFSLFQSPTEAIQKSYIVYMGAHSHGPNPTSIDLETATSSHYAMLSTYKGSEDKAKESMLYSYNTYINGFAAVLDDAEATEIAKHPNVLSVFENKPKKLHTTHTWDFLELEKNGVVSKSSLWKKARFGENTIIGNLDTGAWPESKSFSDDGIGPIPSKWKGVCQDDNNDKFRCNRKLIGARYFNKGYLAYLKLVNGTMSPLQSKTISSPRDTFGHGTHTLSTAGGNFVPGANVFNNGNGTAKGGSPKARVAVYKVCWDGDMCFDSDILAGFEAAIADGVDVLSVSLGGAAVEYFQEGIAIGSFHAVKHGLTVIASAGNDGPGEQTVANTAPWLITVGASTIDREFTAPVTLGNGKILKGQSLSSIPLPSKNMFPLLTGADAKLAKANASEALLCKPNTLDPKKAKGKILVCLRGDNARIEKGQQAALAGAIGMILANTITDGNDVIADPHYLPASHLNYNDANLLFSYIKSTKSPLAHIAQATTLFDVKQSPSMAGFSSRGPSFIEPSILKPDITAPGVNIIAAYSEATAPTDVETDRRRVPFNVDSGTSMACPHVSGVVGLLKTLYPNWSAAAIKSAIMTTARTRDGTKKPILDSDMKKATPFAYGAGHIHPNRAMNPGLVYDMETHDYLNFLCARGYNATTIKLFAHKPYNCPKSFSLVNLNYPSISIPKLGKRTLVVTRRVKNVGGPGIYKALLRAPAGVSVYVKPAILNFDKVGEEKTFEIVFKANVVGKPKTYTFGELKWSDGKHIVRSPIAVKF